MDAPQADAAAAREVTPRKLAVAGVCLLGVTFVPYVEAIVGPLMMLPLTQEFGWTRTQYAFATTFMFVLGAVTGLVFGRIADRYGPRSILMVGALGGGGTMLLLSQQDGHLWQLYLAYALLGAFGSSGLGYTKIMGTLFARHRGKALALFGAESTVAMATLPLLTHALTVNLGWRGAYVVYAVIMFALAPVLWWVIRGPGLSGPAQVAAPSAVAPAEGLTPPQIRRDRTFWLVMLTAVLGGGLNAGLTAHIIAAITDKGFTPATAAGVLSAATLLGLAGTAAAGFAMDHFRTPRILSAFGLTAAAGGVLFAVATLALGGLPLLVAGLAIQRAAMAGLQPGTTYLLTRFVGMRSFGEAFAMQVLVQGLAMGLAPPLFGLLFDRTGTYAPMYAIVIGGAVAAALVYPLLGPYRFRAGRPA